MFDTNITETVINAIRIIKRTILLVLSFLNNFNDIRKAYTIFLCILLILSILIDSSKKNSLFKIRHSIKFTLS